MSLSLSHRAFKAAVRAFERMLRMVSEMTYLKVATALVNELDLVYAVPTRTGPIRIKCQSETARIRAREMLRREPDTLAWIETFAADDVLWDIGSNIGVFSLYAAVVARARVVAIDPLPQNYAAIIDNLALNGLDGRVLPFCVALADRTRVAPLYVPTYSGTAGGAGCPFGDNVDNYGQPIDGARKLPALGYSMDDMLATFDLPFPNHFKIDIDGIQEKVVAGARRTLRDRRLTSAMIELQPENVADNRKTNEFIIGELEAAGFGLVKTGPASPSMTDDREMSVTNNFFERRR
jgi:FkbM family methyltransferase